MPSKKPKPNERKVMNDKFDELAKGLVQSVTRRGALKKFGAGLLGIALASFGLASKAEAGRACALSTDCPIHQICMSGVCKDTSKGNCNHCSGDYGCAPDDLVCIQRCATKCCVIC